MTATNITHKSNFRYFSYQKCLEFLLLDFKCLARKTQTFVYVLFQETFAVALKRIFADVYKQVEIASSELTKS